MKTDPLFYELFRIQPASLFELAGLEAEGEYVFESISVKSTEKRLDGFFRRTDGDVPDIFLEVQGYDDPNIYWRLFQEIFTYYAQADRKTPFTAVILFTDKKYDPEDCPVSAFLPPNRLIIRYLPDCLKSLKHRASPLTVLKPLILEKKKKLPESVPKWKAEIDSLKLSESTEKLLIELLENAIINRFPKITVKEIQNMLHYTPIEKTVVGKELIQIGMNEGILKGLEKGRIEGIEKGRIEGVKKGVRKGIEKGVKKGRIEGIEKGKLIGKIHLAQRLLKRRITSEKKLLSKDTDELKAMLKQLEAELRLV